MCVGTDCYRVWSRTSDAVAEIYETHDRNPNGSPRRYPMPAPDDHIYNIGVFPDLRAVFEKHAQEEMSKLRVEGKDCPNGCYCVESDVVVETESRVPLEVDYVWGTGDRWKIFGSYRLEIRRVLGTCHPLPKKYHITQPIDDRFWALIEKPEQGGNAARS